MSNINMLFGNSTAVLKSSEKPHSLKFAERQDEGSSTALSVCIEEVPKGRVW